MIVPKSGVFSREFPGRFVLLCSIESGHNRQKASRTTATAGQELTPTCCSFGFFLHSSKFSRCLINTSCTFSPKFSFIFFQKYRTCSCYCLMRFWCRPQITLHVFILQPETPSPKTRPIPCASHVSWPHTRIPNAAAICFPPACCHGYKAPFPPAGAPSGKRVT